MLSGNLSFCFSLCLSFNLSHLLSRNLSVSSFSWWSFGSWSFGSCNWSLSSWGFLNWWRSMSLLLNRKLLLGSLFSSLLFLWGWWWSFFFSNWLSGSSSSWSLSLSLFSWSSSLSLFGSWLFLYGFINFGSLLNLSQINLSIYFLLKTSFAGESREGFFLSVDPGFSVRMKVCVNLTHAFEINNSSINLIILCCHYYT